jgi:hypothetical protein
MSKTQYTRSYKIDAVKLAIQVIKMITQIKHQLLIKQNKVNLVNFIKQHDMKFSFQDVSIIEHIDRSKNLFVSYAQQRFWFIDQLQGGSSEYNMPMALQIEGHVI